MRQQLSESFLSHYYWHKNGDNIPWLLDDASNGRLSAVYDGVITAAAAAGDFDESERDDAAVEALTATKKVVIKFPNGLVAFELRFRADGTANDSHVLELFMAAGVDHYNHCATLTILQGTQEYTASSIWFIDKVTPSNESNRWLTARTEMTDESNHIGGYTMNTHGYDRLWIVASTLDTTGGSPNMSNLYVDWKSL
jgi:hypothetical protein